MVGERRGTGEPARVPRFDVRRRAGALVGLESTEASRLGREDVTTWKRNLSQLYKPDDQYGGGGAYELALRSLQRLRRVLHRGSYGPATGEALHTLAGELTRFIGWLAFETGRQAEARYWSLEAAHTARLIEDDRLFVGTLRSMSQQASELGRAPEAIELAQAGTKTTSSGSSSTISSSASSVSPRPRNS